MIEIHAVATVWTFPRLHPDDGLLITALTVRVTGGSMCADR
jgi:hypothetical protein